MLQFMCYIVRNLFDSICKSNENVKSFGIDELQYSLRKTKIYVEENVIEFRFDAVLLHLCSAHTNESSCIEHRTIFCEILYRRPGIRVKIHAISHELDCSISKIQLLISSVWRHLRYRSIAHPHKECKVRIIAMLRMKFIDIWFTLCAHALFSSFFFG